MSVVRGQTFLFSAFSAPEERNSLEKQHPLRSQLDNCPAPKWTEISDECSPFGAVHLSFVLPFEDSAYSRMQFFYGGRSWNLKIFQLRSDVMSRAEESTTISLHHNKIAGPDGGPEALGSDIHGFPGRSLILVANEWSPVKLSLLPSALSNWEENRHCDITRHKAWDLWTNFPW